MSLIEKVTNTVSQSVDFIIDKNRQLAQLNRLDAIIKNETEIINNAYIKLGKIYLSQLEGNAQEEANTDLLINSIKTSKERLTKAKARYEYTKIYGVPQPGFNEDVAAQQVQKAEEVPDEKAETEEEPEDEDITIAYVAPESESADEQEKEESKPVEAKKPETASEYKKKRSSKKKAVVRESDLEAANETDAESSV